MKGATRSIRRKHARQLGRKTNLTLVPVYCRREGAHGGECTSQTWEEIAIPDDEHRNASVTGWDAVLD